MNMNTLIENTLLKMGVGLQTMTAPKVPAILKNLFKSQTPLEKLNQERAAMGYDPLTQSEWLAGAVAQSQNDGSELNGNKGWYGWRGIGMDDDLIKDDLN
jgi:hypothetical protein